MCTDECAPVMYSVCIVYSVCNAFLPKQYISHMIGQCIERHILVLLYMMCVDSAFPCLARTLICHDLQMSLCFVCVTDFSQLYVCLCVCVISLSCMCVCVCDFSQLCVCVCVCVCQITFS